MSIFEKNYNEMDSRCFNFLFTLGTVQVEKIWKCTLNA